MRVFAFAYCELYYILFSLLYRIFKCCYTTEHSQLGNGAHPTDVVDIAYSSVQSASEPLRVWTYITIRDTLSCRQLAFRVPIFAL